MDRRTPERDLLPADVIVAGSVVTLDPDRPRAEAFAVAGNTILAVGDLDEVRAACAPGTPVDRPAGAAIVPGLIDAHHHLGWTGLKLLRLVPDATTPADEALRILGEDAFSEPWLDGEPTREQRVEGIVRAQALLHELGITGVIDPAVTPPELAAYAEARRRDLLTMRVVPMPHPDVSAGAATVVERLNGLGLATGFGDELLRLGGVKVYFDGVGMSGTALRREPWPTDPGRAPIPHPGAGPHGWQRLPTEDFATIARACAEGGWSMGVHVVGGGGIGTVLETWAAIDREIPIRELRFTLIHAYLEPSPEDMALAARLGVVVAAQPSIQWVNGQGLVDRLGAEAAASNPLRAWLDAGVVVAGGSDGPDFPFDPRLGLWEATTRGVRGGDAPVGPEQAVTPAEALAMYTRDASFASGAVSSRYRGVLAPGMAADWTAISVDPLTEDRDALLTATFSRTTIGGVAVHASDGGPPSSPRDLVPHAAAPASSTTAPDAPTPPGAPAPTARTDREVAA
jgi:predicted amidohydrolase YtcJ